MDRPGGCQRWQPDQAGQNGTRAPQGGRVLGRARLVRTNLARRVQRVAQARDGEAALPSETALTAQLARGSWARIPAGWAAKLINVYLKTAAYVGNLGRPGLRCVLHPPVDNRLKDGLLKLFTTCPKIHDAVSFPSITSIAEYNDYQKIIEGCKAAADCLKCDLIEVDRFPLIG